MADKNLNSITFPGLPDKYKVAQVADEYSSSSTYAVGDIVNYLGTTYRCITAITTAENWTAGHWTPVKIADEVTDLKNAVNLIEYSVNSNNDGQFIWDLRYGYWVLDSESIVWRPVNNKSYVSSAYPINVKSGDFIHIKDSSQILFFAMFSENGSTWSVLTNTTNHDVNIPSDGYVMVCAKKNQLTAFTEEEVELFFDRYLTIYRKAQTNNVIKQIVNINDAKGVIVNDASFVQGYVTASTSTTEGGVTVPIEFPATKGETFVIGANISVFTHPEYFSKIMLSVRERYNNQTVLNTSYDDLTQPIEYTARNTNTSSIIFVIGWVKQSASSVDVGYYENFNYSIYVTKKNDDFSDVMTESGDAWEV